jgi:alkyl hydroperoxide reductase subunit AhpC
VLGLSSDPSASLKSWAGSMGGIGYPLLADFWPHCEVLRAYGYLNEERGTARRAAVIIDKEGIVRWVNTYEPGAVPTSEELLGALDKVQG